MHSPNPNTRTYITPPCHILHPPLGLASTPAGKATPPLKTLFDTYLPSTPPQCLCHTRETWHNFSTSTGTDPTCHTREVGSWEPLPATWLIHRVWQHPWLSTQHQFDCVIHTETPVTHNLQWDSPKAHHQDTPGQNTQLSVDTPPDVQWQ